MDALLPSCRLTAPTPLPSDHVAQATAKKLDEFRKRHNRKRSTTKILNESKDMLSMGLTTLENGELIPDASSMSAEMAERSVELSQAVKRWMAKQTDEGLTNLLDSAMVRFCEQQRLEAPGRAASSMDVDAGSTAAPPAPNGEEADPDAHSTSASVQVDATAMEAPGRAASSMDVDAGSPTALPALNGEQEADADADSTSASAQVDATAVDAPGRAASSMGVDQQTATPSAPNGEGGNADADSTSAPADGEHPSAPPTLVTIDHLRTLGDHCGAGSLESAAAEECEKRVAQFKWLQYVKRTGANWLWAELRGAYPHTITIAIMKQETRAHGTTFILWVPRGLDVDQKRAIKSAVEGALKTMPTAAPKRTAAHAQLDQPGSKRASRGRSS